MTTRPDLGGLLAGAFFTILGVTFILEAAGAWTFRLTDLRVVAPMVLIVVGLAILLTATSRARQAPSGSLQAPPPIPPSPGPAPPSSSEPASSPTMPSEDTPTG